MNPRHPIDPPDFESYPEDDEDIAPSVPGIDDCDHLYSLSSRSGDTSVYLRIQEAKPGRYYCQLTVDSNAPEGDNFVEDITGIEGPYALPEFAFRDNVEAAREWFRNNRLAYVYCSDSRRIVKSRQYPPPGGYKINPV